MVRIFIGLLCGLLSILSLQGQSQEQRVGNVQAYTENYAEEKIYLHLEKEVYYPGETIWFKAYLGAGALLVPSPISKILYVELVNENGFLVGQQKYTIEDGQAHGSIEIELGLEEASYALRAYTQYQQKHDPEILFEKRIRVLHNQGVPSGAVSVSGKVMLDFFPEGGNLVPGLKNKIAFKATDEKGNERSVKGAILNSAKDSISSFESSHFGMGAFDLISEKEETYYAVVEGDTSQIILPFSNISFGVTRTKEGPVKVDLNNSDTSATPEVILIVHFRGYTTFIKKVKTNKDKTVLYLDYSIFPAGISVVTLTDLSFNPLAERLYFNSDLAFLNVELSLPQIEFKRNSRVEVEISAELEDGSPAEGWFSMFAYDMNQVESDTTTDDISSYFLLSSELKGKVASPASVLKNAEAVDLVMLTNGWRRYDWTEISREDHKIKNEMLADVVTLKGQVNREGRDKPLEGAIVSLVNQSSPDPLIGQETTDENGRFDMGEVQFNSDDQVYLRVENLKRGYDVKIDSDSLQKIIPVDEGVYFVQSEAEKKETALKSSFFNPLILGGNYTQLDDIEVVAEKEVVNSTVRAYGKGTYTYEFDQDVLATTAGGSILSVLPGVIPSVQVSDRLGKPNLIIRGSDRSSLSGNTTPLILIDGVQVELETLASFSARDFESIEVYMGSNTAQFGARGAQGVIALTTRMPDITYQGGKKVYPVSDLGFDRPKEFYSPSYENEPSKEQDVRSIIHWAPMIRTDENGKAKVVFWNTNLPSTVMLDFQGFTDKGVTASKRAFYFVN